MAAAAFLEQHTDLQLAGSGAEWSISIETIELTMKRVQMVFAPKDPLRELYARLAREYDETAAVRTRSGGLPGELIKL